MEKNIASIYKIVNNLTDRIYIGFDISYPKRIKQHHNDSKRGVASPLCDDIRQYGWDNFSKELIYQSWDPKHCLDVMEKHFIIENKSYVEGYNRTLGGNGSLNSPRPKSKTWRKNHSERMAKNNPRIGYKFTDEEKQKHSNIMIDFYQKNPDKKLMGEKNGMYCKTHTPEWRINHSLVLKQKYKNGEVKRIEKVSCSYCDLRVIPGNLKRHENVCDNNPNRKPRKK